MQTTAKRRPGRPRLEVPKIATGVQIDVPLLTDITEYAAARGIKRHALLCALVQRGWEQVRREDKP